MLRNTLRRCGCLLLLAAGSAFPSQQEPAAADADRERDVYTIYSLLMTNPRTSHGPDNNQLYLIQAETGPGIPTPPCVAPPPDRIAEFQQVLADYESRGSTPKLLKRALTLAKPYVLASAGQVKAFREDRFLPKPGQQREEQFRGVQDVFTLSEVYFNPGRTLAMTAMSSWCGSLCGLWEWRVFEKTTLGNWEERPWVHCSTIAGMTPLDRDGYRRLQGRLVDAALLD
jgi:hypothetical protein